MTTMQWQQREKIADWMGHDPLQSVASRLAGRQYRSYFAVCRLVPGFRNKTVEVHDGELLGYSGRTAEII
jgi:hypothetical protein